MRLLSLFLLGLTAVAQPALAQTQPLQQVQAPAPAPAPSAPAAPSGGPSAIELMQLCFEGSAKGTISNPMCVGYLTGFIGAVRIARTVSEDFPICLPQQGLTNQQVVNDVSAYLEQHEEQLQRSARSVFFLVMTELYPCQQQQ